jgi:hypothetical protein
VPIRVRADPDGRPVAVRRHGWPRPRAVARTQDCWRVDDEWWRASPIARLYYALLLEDGTLLTVCHDLAADTWLEQRDRDGAARP